MQARCFGELKESPTTSSVPHKKWLREGAILISVEAFDQRRLLVMIIVMMPIDVSCVMRITGFSGGWRNK